MILYSDLPNSKRYYRVRRYFDAKQLKYSRFHFAPYPAAVDQFPSEKSQIIDGKGCRLFLTLTNDQIAFFKHFNVLR